MRRSRTTRSRICCAHRSCRCCPRSNLHVAADLRKIRKRQALSAVLLVRGDLIRGFPLQIADGYHRVCASYYVDENTDIPCRLIDLPTVVARNWPRPVRPRSSARSPTMRSAASLRSARSSKEGAGEEDGSTKKAPARKTPAKKTAKAPRERTGDRQPGAIVSACRNVD